MYLGYFILVPLLIVLWIYVIIIVKNNFVSNTSIEVNIIDHQIESHPDLYNVSGSAGTFKQAKKKIKHHIPKFMLELYEENKSVRKNEADLVRSLIPTQAEKLEKYEILEELSENHLLIFNIPSSAKEERFIGAELKILTQIEINSNIENGVKKFLKISVYDDKTKSFSYLRELEIHHFNDTWLSFNLTRKVEDILGMKAENRILKVIIAVSTFYHQSQNNLKLSILPATENSDHDYPILLLSYSIEDDNNEITKTNQANHVRKRRNVDEDYEEETNIIWTGENNQKKNLKKYKRNNCRRRPLYVDFSEIKYDLWIVQPTGYDAYQCQGRCFYPVAEHLSPTKHAIMQALIHSFNPLKASRSCCVPTLLDSISILYVDDKGVLTYRYAYKDMVVLECGCR